MTTICSICRGDVAREFAYCPHCGTPAQHPAPAAIPVPPPPHAVRGQQSEAQVTGGVEPATSGAESPWPGGGWVWTIGAALVVVALVAVSDSPPTTNSASAAGNAVVQFDPTSTAERARDSATFAALLARASTASRADLVQLEYLAHRWTFRSGHDSATHRRATSALLDSAADELRGSQPSTFQADILMQSVWLPLTTEQASRKERLVTRLAAARVTQREQSERESKNSALDAIVSQAPCKTSRAKVRRSMERHPGWDASVISAVVCGRVQTGMTKEQALAAWGRPRDINRTTSSYGTREQWVYGESGSGYLYFEDDRLTTVQN